MKMTKKFFSLVLCSLLVFALVGCTKPKEEVVVGAKDGTYSVVTTGMFEGLTVDTTFEGGKITSVVIGENTETPTIAEGALTTLPAAIVASQSIMVDAISGATRTSEGIVDGVKQAIEQAGGNVEDFSSAVETVDVFNAELTNNEVPTTWDKEVDVIVVGGGFAGLAATHTAAEAGADTLLVEKMPVVGGNSAINGGQYASYTSDAAAELQEKFDLVPDTAQQHIEDTIKGGDNEPIEELVSVMVNGSPIYFNKLLSAGLVIRDTLARPGGHYGYRTYVTENSIGSDIVEVQKTLVEQTDAVVETNAKMVQIYKVENTVVGIQVATQDGLKNYKANQGVILATGGFSANVEMRLLYDEKLTADIPTTNAVSATGEGLQMAMDLGADTLHMDYIQRYPWADPNTGVLDTVAVMPFTGPSYGVIYVDQDGNRYVNEGERRDVCANAAVATGGTSTFSIFTKEIVSFSTDEDIEKGIAAGRIFKADTIEELVTLINAQQYQGASVNLTAETLQATIDAHNSYIESGVDADFEKVMSDTMLPITQGPYYAIPQWPSVHHTMGGLSITTNAQVKDVDGNIIDNLYAAGEITGGIHGTNRLGSNADADACTFGYVAGHYAVTKENPVTK